MNFYHSFLIFLCLLLPSISLAATDPIDAGQTAFARGQFAQAARHWEATTFNPEQKPAEYMDTGVRLAIAYQSLGFSRKALKRLHAVLVFAAQSGDAVRHASVLAHLGDVYLAIGDFPQTRIFLEKAAAVAPPGHLLLRANLLNKQGNLHMAQEQYLEAIAAYRQCVELAAGRAGDKMLEAKTRVNLLRAAMHTGKAAGEYLSAALRQVQDLEISHDKAFLYIALAQMMRDIPAAQRGKAPLSAHSALKQAMDIAETLGDERAASYATGLLGLLYADAGRTREAAQLTRQAIFRAQQNEGFHPELLYRWERQLGQLLRAQGQTEKAVLAYRRALEYLKRIRPELQGGGYRERPRSFREAEGGLYFELADILLQQTGRASADEKPQSLQEAKRIVELFKRHELEKYFKDSCIAAPTQLDRPPARTAVLYPVLLADRIELLLSLADGTRQYAGPSVSAAELQETARQFREKVENFTPENILLRGIEDVLLPARQLYDWLIRPVTADLAAGDIDTLVIVADGILGAVPFAALHDGEAFLIERYALAVTPSVELVDPRPLPRDNARTLLAGLSEAVQGFPPLSHVQDELSNIAELWGGDILENADFTLANLSRQLEKTPYAIIHFATQGHIGKDPRQTFLLTHDGKLTIDRLEELLRFSESRRKPVELIVFSTSQTAQGDEQALLGLAGIAIKAGARSALASLWTVSDAATAELMTEFYRQLQDPALSKAQALRAAQLQLLADYEHPYFWAAFLLIGNWL
ncbi:MAG: CHAT domain-containing protein [Gammaproteobacteria bacterium]|nr:CHAT domain-containing protein [Gammaproteobacteria bacterium]